MLLLSRKTGERIIITLPSGETISLFIVEIRGDQVRLSFDAPRSISIVRSEIKDSI